MDCALPLLQGDHLEKDQIPQITSLAYRDGLNMAVGTSTGHILLYDIRSSRPLLVKDHLYGTPIKSLIFHSTQDQVISLDGKALKIWDRLTGKPYTSIGNFKTIFSHININRSIVMLICYLLLNF